MRRSELGTRRKAAVESGWARVEERCIETRGGESVRASEECGACHSVHICIFRIKHRSVRTGVTVSYPMHMISSVIR